MDFIIMYDKLERNWRFKEKKTYNILEIKLILYVEANNFIINYNIPAQ